MKIARLSPPLGCRQRAKQGVVGYTRQHSEDNKIKSLNQITNHQTHSLRCSLPLAQAICLILIKHSHSNHPPNSMLAWFHSVLTITSTQISPPIEAKRVILLQSAMPPPNHLHNSPHRFNFKILHCGSFTPNSSLRSVQTSHSSFHS